MRDDDIQLRPSLSPRRPRGAITDNQGDDGHITSPPSSIAALDEKQPHERLRLGRIREAPRGATHAITPKAPTRPRGNSLDSAKPELDDENDDDAPSIVAHERQRYGRPLRLSGEKAVPALTASLSPLALLSPFTTKLDLQLSKSPVFRKATSLPWHRSRIEWKKGELIGEGTFGKVYKGLNCKTGELFAVKAIDLGIGTDDDDDKKKLAKLGEEIAVMKELQHVHIVRYQGTDRDDLHFYIFMEYVPNGSIASMLAQFGVFGVEMIQKFTRQILEGVAYLHSKGIIHRDIKGANVLVNEHGQAKLADFGCSKQVPSTTTTDSLEESLRSIRGSVPWMAPEVVQQTGHDCKADIWSVGATVLEMATAHHPWPANTNHLSVMYHLAVKPSSPPIPADLPPLAKAFLARCFCIDARERATAIELLAHPFLR
ncbi:ste/ste11/ste11-unclassified protein kinase [Saprolegnia parasitica CBS 223.65]|uniref:Ste/ste11/ste11-unclassified protein kinase n=1 Tax=Saprolegnia parasitica (strain CBS 223.65) TaxID=695850 RepID=A0A067BHF2_SAPPC|nr:ste/ste11/ste11-unclassified protein kinase [Saprolegnia parasitica CBS 223.65]KDO17608.1 ste/ste11/ste11-unclassified protein kinase [Saprolegnia parasitica CBS 223.65]|eukprot:XP_012211687.1 ste/ste11/ste11-unclassified protein kinase [Saprolegnia parasitica CBS 223.65]